MRDEIVRVVEKTRDGDFVVSPVKLEVMKKRVAAITSGEELYAVVMAIAKLGVVLSEKQASAASETLYAWVNELAPKLKKLARADGMRMKAQAQRAVKEAAKVIRETNAASEPKGIAPKSKSGVGIRKR